METSNIISLSDWKENKKKNENDQQRKKIY